MDNHQRLLGCCGSILFVHSGIVKEIAHSLRIVKNYNASFLLKSVKISAIMLTINSL